MIQYEIGTVVEDSMILGISDYGTKNPTYHMICLECGRAYSVSRVELFERHKLFHSECIKEANVRKDGYRFYRIWIGMNARTNNPKDTAYKWYGAKGIENLYDTFDKFVDDQYENYKIGAALFGEDNISIDRIDPKGNYEPSNVRWRTQEYQANNTTAQRKLLAVDPNNNLHYIHGFLPRFCEEHDIPYHQVRDTCSGKKERTVNDWTFRYIDDLSLYTYEVKDPQ